MTWIKKYMSIWWVCAGGWLLLGPTGIGADAWQDATDVREAARQLSAIERQTKIVEAEMKLSRLERSAVRVASCAEVQGGIPNQGCPPSVDQLPPVGEHSVHPALTTLQQPEPAATPKDVKLTCLPASHSKDGKFITFTIQCGAAGDLPDGPLTFVTSRLQASYHLSNN